MPASEAILSRFGYETGDAARDPVQPLGPSLVTISGEQASSKIILRGRERILALQLVLRELARFTGQPGAADDLAFFLTLPASLRKNPVLVLTRAAQGEPSVHDLKDATFVFEYRLLQRGLGIYASADSTGRRTVLAPPGRRASTAGAAVAALIAEGAHLVHLSFQPDPLDRADAPGSEEIVQQLPPEVQWALTEHSIPLYLPLGRTNDETLAHIGQRTRSNLRYYRRRTEREVGCVYLPEIHTTLQEFLAFNRESMYAVPDALATWRFQAFQSIAEPLFVGVADRDGRWLSLAGGRRRGSEVEIDWQMNRQDLPHLSLSTVLRSCLIEAEVARGSTRLFIEGGTPHPIGRSFTQSPVTELTVKRNSAYIRLLTRFGLRFLPEKNYIRQLLADPALLWHDHPEPRASG